MTSTIRFCTTYFLRPTLLAVGFLLPALSAWAALGGVPIAQSGAFSAVIRTTQSSGNAVLSGYTLHTVELASGTQLEEWASSDGTVFAVRWQGPVLPDWSAVLGGYAASFHAEGERSRAAGRRGPLTVALQDLVVYSGGHQRSYHGYAYVSSLVPAGVDVLSLLR